MAANAVPFAFDCISNNNTTNCTTGETQLSVDVTDAGGGVTKFLFSNSGPLSSSITDIYFDWLNPGAALSGGSIIDFAGVAFSWGASPSDLPAGNNATPDFNANISADSDSPASHNGVNPGEFVGFTFTTSFASVLSSLTNGDLRLGIHVQAFANGGSEAFVNTPPRVSVPEPGMLALFGLVLAGLGLVRRRRSI
jgi:hypothetical protein